MGTQAKNCIQSRHIDSFQKLRVLLFLYEHPDTIESAPALARRLYLGDVGLMKEIILELYRDGFLEETEVGYKLHRTPEIEKSLLCLQQNFARPLRRQRLFNEVSRGSLTVSEAEEPPNLEFVCEHCSLYINNP